MKDFTHVSEYLSLFDLSFHELIWWFFYRLVLYRKSHKKSSVNSEIFKCNLWT